MKNRAGGFPAFTTSYLAKASDNPKSGTSPLAGVPACSPLSLAATLKVCSAGLAMLLMMGKRRYRDRMLDLSSPPDDRLI